MVLKCLLHNYNFKSFRPEESARRSPEALCSGAAICLTLIFLHSENRHQKGAGRAHEAESYGKSAA